VLSPRKYTNLHNKDKRNSQQICRQKKYGLSVKPKAAVKKASQMIQFYKIISRCRATAHILSLCQYIFDEPLFSTAPPLAHAAARVPCPLPAKISLMYP